MRKFKSRKSQSKPSSKPGKKTGSRSKKHDENVKKSTKSNSKKRGPSPDELEDKREMHRIHERQRHYSLNLAIRKIICALPSCEPSEPETKHYVLKKTSDYIQFLEDKIAELCLDNDIDQTNDSGDLSFSAPLHTLIDGFQKEIPADTPVSMESIQELLARLNYKVDKSLTTKKKSSKSKKGAMKKRRCKKESFLQVGEISDECLQDDDEMKDEDVESLGAMNTQDSLLASGSMTGMLCSESTIEMDGSRSSQMNSSSASSSWGTRSLDDGFSSSKMTTDQESTQESSSSNSSHDLSQGRDSLADLIGREAGVKYIPTLPEVNQRSGSNILNQWSQHSTLQQVVLPLPAFSHNQLAVPSVDKGRPISFLCHGDGNEPYIQPDSTTFLPLQQGKGNFSGVAIAPTSANRLLPSLGCQYGQDTQHTPIPMTSQRQPLSHGNAPGSPRSKNILNQSLVSDSDPNPTFGYINCTLSNCSAGKVIGPKHGISYTSVHPYETYHPQASLFQPVKQTVEIILDMGDDPMVLKSLLGQQTCFKRSGINGFELFTKVNIKRFQDGWPALKSKEITRLIGQAWQEIPDNFKQLYGKRACAWNQSQKKQAGFKSTLLDP